MLIKVLERAANINIYKSKSNFYKFWWDEELNILKENSISAHNQWFSDGKPRSGRVFVAMNTAKLQYRNTIRSKERNFKNEFSNDVHEALMQKDMTSFWKQ